MTSIPNAFKVGGNLAPSAARLVEVRDEPSLISASSKKSSNLSKSEDDINALVFRFLAFVEFPIVLGHFVNKYRIN